MPVWRWVFEDVETLGYLDTGIFGYCDMGTGIAAHLDRRTSVPIAIGRHNGRRTELPQLVTKKK